MIVLNMNREEVQSCNNVGEKSPAVFKEKSERA